MRFGPDACVSCPHCGEKARYQTLLCGNTFGATLWTDGKRLTPIFVEPPQFVRCSACAACYWFEDAAHLDDESFDEEAAEREGMPWLQEADEADMYRAPAAGGTAVGPHERRFRVLAWWSSHDPLRTEHPEPPAVDPALAQARGLKLQGLLRVLDPTEINDRIMRAEVHRELGDFDAARRQLDTLREPDLAGVIAQFHAVCEAGDTQLRQVRFG